MNVLLIGAGVIGTVYGAQLATAGNTVSVYEHGERTNRIKKTGLITKDTLTGVCSQQSVKVVSDSSTVTYDLVLIALREDQLASVFPILKRLGGEPTILLFGNNPKGRSILPKNLSKRVELGFPGIGGSMHGDTVEYLRIAQQPTAVQTDASNPTIKFAETLRSKGFKVNAVADMEGYLLYHAVFVASISMALYRCNSDPILLASHRASLSLMCKAIEEGFRALRSQGLGGEPRNLRTLHMPWLRPFAIWYWGRTFRSPLGELEFAAHARHAKDEINELAQAVIAATKNSPTPRDHLKQLLINGEL